MERFALSAKDQSTPKCLNLQLQNHTVKPSLSGNSNTLSFDLRKFAGGYNESRFSMYFPTKGVQLPIPKVDSFSSTLEGFRRDIPALCESSWDRYLLRSEHHCGLEHRGCAALPDGDRIPCEMMMLAGVLQVDDKILQASFKRLYGRFIDAEDTPISEDELRTVAFALWNPFFVHYKHGDTWAEFVDGRNLQHSIRLQQQARQEAALAELLTELV